MLDIIRLEYRKNRFNKYLLPALICNVAIIITTLLFNRFLGEGGIPAFSTYNLLIADVSSITREVYIIFSSVLIVHLIVNEYKNNTINILFSYPKSRYKLLGCKIIMIMLFISMTSLISTIINTVAVVIISNQMSFITTNILRSDIMLGLKYAFTNGIISPAVGMIPLVFGIKKKSVFLTLSVAIALVYWEELLDINQLLLVSLLGFLSIVLSMWRLNKVDIKL